MDKRMQHIMLADRQFREDRIKLFRRYLEAYVVGMTPMLVDLLHEWNTDLQAALRSLRPRAGWPLRELGKIKTYGKMGRWSRPDYWRPAQSPRNKKSGKSMSLLVRDGIIDVRLSYGKTRCTTGYGKLELWIPRTLPETVAAAMIGRPLSAVVEHQAFERLPYPILRAETFSGLTIILAEAPELPLTIEPYSL